MSAYLQLEFLLSADDLDLTEAALFELGAHAVTLLDAEDQLLVEYERGENPVWNSMRVLALFDLDADLDSLRAELALVLGPPGGGAWQLTFLADQDWHRAWMDRFEPLHFGQRLCVCPTWHKVPEQCSHPILLDPGTAFGTGTHATTAMCLRWLDGREYDGQTVVDFGSGSGVLAIAAALLGGKRVVAIDNDPDAVTHSLENMQRNQLDMERCTVHLDTNYPDLRGETDLLIANILAAPLVRLAPQLCELLAPGGQILLSGILEEQVESVIAAYNDIIRFEKPTVQDGWVMLVGRNSNCNSDC
ncbi:MAG: 50S ribosomal protein L11 methyltransferase [Pseudomonadales bacterium]